MAPQVDRVMKEQCYAYVKQAGIKENEVQYSEIGTGQWLPKMVAALEAGNPPDVTRFGQGAMALYRAQGHLLELTNLVEKMQQTAGVLAGLPQNRHAPGEGLRRPIVRQSLAFDHPHGSPRRRQGRPRTWDELIEVCQKLQKPPKLTGFGMCLGLHTDADHNIMDMIWGYGGKLVEADDKTVALNSLGTVQAVKLIADMFHTHKIIPKGAISWDNQGNNKAYQSRQVIFVLNPSSIYAHLAESDKSSTMSPACSPCRPGQSGRSRNSARMSGCSSSAPIPRSPKGWSSTIWNPRTYGW